MDFQRIESQPIGASKVPAAISKTINEYRELVANKKLNPEAGDEYIGRKLFQEEGYEYFLIFLDNYTASNYWNTRRLHMRACDAADHKCYLSCPYYHTREICDLDVLDTTLDHVEPVFIPQQTMVLPKPLPKYKIVNPEETKAPKKTSKRKSKTKKKSAAADQKIDTSGTKETNDGKYQSTTKTRYRWENLDSEGNEG